MLLQPLKKQTTYILSPRCHGGTFIIDASLKKIYNYLTKINKHITVRYKSIGCKDTIFPIVKPAVYRVNKFSRLTTHDLRLPTNYRIPLLNAIFTTSISMQ